MSAMRAVVRIAGRAEVWTGSDVLEKEKIQELKIDPSANKAGGSVLGLLVFSHQEMKNPGANNANVFIINIGGQNKIDTS